MFGFVFVSRVTFQSNVIDNFHVGGPEPRGFTGPDDFAKNAPKKREREKKMQRQRKKSLLQGKTVVMRTLRNRILRIATRKRVW